MIEFRGRKVLVVGGAGFVGSNVVRALLAAESAEVVVVDNLLSSERENLPPDGRVRFVEGSITDERILSGLPNDLEHVFHLATYHGNQSSIANPLADHENNTLTTLKLYERLRSIASLRKVVYSSAGCTVAEKTFDDAEATKENDPVSLHLDSPYQISKIVGEMYSNFYHRQHGLPVVMARFQNVYGPGEVLGAGQWRGTPATVWRNVTPTFVYRALKRHPLIVENEGIATRDFIYVDDIVRGLLLCAAVGKPGDVYNLASGVETSIRDLAVLVNERTGNTVSVLLGPKRDWDRSGKRFGCTQKSRRELGFDAAVKLETGIDRTVAWARANLRWIDAVVMRHKSRMPDLEQIVAGAPPGERSVADANGGASRPVDAGRAAPR